MNKWISLYSQLAVGPLRPERARQLRCPAYSCSSRAQTVPKRQQSCFFFVYSLVFWFLCCKTDILDSSTKTTTITSSPENHGKKRKSRWNKWEENIRKRRRNGGRGYVSKAGRETPRKKFRYINNCCCSEFDGEEQKVIFKSFWSLKDKEKQDPFLLGCVHTQNIKYAKSNPKTKSRQYSWKYTWKWNNLDKPVCKQFLTTLLQITERRMKIVLQFSKKGTSDHCT